MRSHQLYPILLSVILTACIDTFSPKIDGKVEEIVIDGMITDETKAHTVYISRTKDINDISSNPTGLAGATVRISDDAGNTYHLGSTELGVYQTAPGVTGVAGRAYQLSVILDGKEYRSEPEVLVASGDVLSIGAQYRTSYAHPITNEALNNVVVFDIDVENKAGATDYYKYDWDATYKIRSPFADDPDSCTTFTGATVPPYCFTNETSQSFLNILSLDNFSGSTYVDHVFMVIDPQIRFMSRFSLNVKQYGISERAYTYWNTIKAQSFGTGSLFDPPPSKIIGNIRSLSDSKENVLGYFMAASVKTKRGFYNADLVTSNMEHFSNCDCYPWRTICKPPLPPGVQQPPVPPKRVFCCDCSNYPNSSAATPSFWID